MKPLWSPYRAADLATLKATDWLTWRDLYRAAPWVTSDVTELATEASTHSTIQAICDEH